MADGGLQDRGDGEADVLDRLDPVVLHHIVNTLGWPNLRPLQRAAITPLMAGQDAVLLAPTAGGKTEAACFPLLSAMAEQKWTGTSVLYLCPLKALLNNLVGRVDTYAQWLGRRAALWHGDTKESVRQRLRAEAPDILLTTPESLEAMLIGVKTDHARLLGSVRAVVVDEVHAFAGDDRGWHLLAVLERLERVTGQPIQRVGLSATVGNPDQLLRWLQGAGAGTRTGHVVAPAVLSPPAGGGHDGAAPPRPAGDVELDYVGSLDNAAKLIAALHKGEKRLVFCDSRRQVEELGAALRAREVTVFLSHASLSVDERTRSEQAFAEARDCVIVSTSTLELASSRSTRRPPSPRSCNASAVPAGVPALCGTACSSPPARTPCCRRRACCCCGRVAGWNRSSRRRIRAIWWPSKCSPSPCSSTNWGTGCGTGSGTASPRSTGRPRPSCATSPRRASSTTTAGCCSSVPRRNAASGSGTSSN
jgi:ATP-dependent Lhr-like helicase